MHEITVGDIFELEGEIPVIITAMDNASNTVKCSYKGGPYRAMDMNEFTYLAIKKIGSMDPQFAEIENIINLAV